jgi:hypothetical protein
VAVTEKFSDACCDGKYYLPLSFLASEDAGVSRASIVVDRKSTGHTVVERSWKDADFVCISCIYRGGYGKVCDARGDGEYYFLSICMAS